MNSLFVHMIFCSVVSVVLLSVMVPSVYAGSEGGPLEQLGDMLGFDSTSDNSDDGNSNDDGANDLENTALTGDTLPIPSITQREEPTAAAPDSALPKEEFAMKAELRPDELVQSYWDLTGFGLNVSPGSDICRQDNCEFEIDEGKLRPDFMGGYILEGRLKVGVQEEAGTRTNLYNIRGELGTTQTFEQNENTTDFLRGKLKIGSGTLVGPAPIEYNISNGTLVHDENEATLILRGERNL